MPAFNWIAEAKHPVKLADYIEFTLRMDGDHPSDEFNAGHFTAVMQESPPVAEYDADEAPGSFLAGDAMDETREQFDDAVALIERRRQWLGGLYPFSVTNGAVQLRYGQTVDNGMPYIFLLACSLHHEIDSGQGLDRQFERVCKEGMRTLFNESADVFLFSQFSQDRAELGRSAREAIPRLAEKLNATVKNEADIPDQPNEFGIDLIAIDRLGDSVGYPFFALAQCTIGQDWPHKKGEAKLFNALAAYVDLPVQHSNLIFIPHFLRKDADKWDARPHDTIGCIIFDRLRICRMLERLKAFNDSVPLETLNSVLKEFSGKFFN